MLLTFFMYILRRELPVCVACWCWCEDLPWVLEPRDTCPLQPKEWRLGLAAVSVSSSTEFWRWAARVWRLMDWDLEGGSEGMYQDGGESRWDGGRMEQHPSLFIFLSATSLKFVVLFWFCLSLPWPL